MTDKFKVGDLVIVVRNNEYFPYGAKLRVNKADGDRLPLCIGISLRGIEEDYYMDEDDLELSKVCDSPLWKALE